MAKDQKQSSDKVLQRVQVKACQCVVCKKEDGSLMCGQCYYDRFEKELSKDVLEMTKYYSLPVDVILKDAKKAAGL